MNAEQLARALGFKRSGNQWVGCCVAHDDKNPSMIIFVGRNGLAQVRCLAGCSSDDIVEVLRDRGLWQGQFGQFENERPWDDDELEKMRQFEERERVRKQKLAFRIWEEVEGPRDTPAEDYLAGRGLELPPDADEVIGFHPHCLKVAARVPALIALMRDPVSFKPVAINRLFLAKDPITGFWVKTDGMMLGGSGAMMVTNRFNTFWDDLSFCPKLFVCEGLETGLALHQAGHKPVWALGSASAIASFPVIFGVGEIEIRADHDENGTSQRAAAECAKRWNATTHQRARIVMPREEGTDFADVYQRRGLDRGG